MRPSFRFSFAFVILFALCASGCKQSSEVVSDGWIQKRKYRKGWHVEGIKKRKQAAVASEIQSKRVDGKISTRLPLKQARFPKLTPSRMTKLPKKARHQVEVWAPTMALSAESGIKRNSTQSVEPFEDEEVETPKALSLAAKLSAAGSALLALATFVGILIAIFSSVSATGGLLLAFMGVAAVLGLLFSLLLSYIIMERYEDEIPMQWTIWSAYIFIGIIAVFSYSVLFLAAA